MPTDTWPELPATTPDPAPADPEGDRPPRTRLRVVVARYLMLAVVLLGVVLATDPHDADRASAPDGHPWAYQKESVTLKGDGLLNSYARGLTHATAWLARSSIERVRDLNRLNLLDFLVGEPTARQLADWRADHGTALENTTRLAVLALVGYGVVKRPPRRTWVLALLLLLSATVLVTKPRTVVQVASAPSTAIPNLTMAAFGQLDPAQPPGRSTEQAAEALARAYWDGFVGHPLSRLQSGSTVLTGAPPEDKPGVLASLREQVRAVNDWAVGERGLERAVISTLALAYVLPFAVSVGVVAMVATSAQAMLFLLLLAALVVIPLAVDRRRRPTMVSLWLLPLLGTAAVLAGASLTALILMRVGAAVHALDEYLGMLLAGSVGPVLLVVLLRLRAVRRRRARHATSSNTSTNQGASS